VVALYGCIAYSPIPTAARAGDTITVAVGSPDGMTKNNVSVNFQPDAGGPPVDLTNNVAAIFKLYPDPSSPLIAGNWGNVSTIYDNSGHVPWLTVVAIDLPPEMPVGTGKINVNTTAVYPTNSASVNLIPITFEILPGTGSPHNRWYNIGSSGPSWLSADLSTVQPPHQVMVRPKFPATAEWPTYGAIQLKLRFADGAPPSKGFQFITDDASLFTGSERNVSYSVSGDQLLVMYTSAHGWLSYTEPRFGLVPRPVRSVTQPPPVTMPTAPPILLSVDYYDVDGNVVSGPPTTDYVITLE
jgi:hypothetical protein